MAALTAPISRADGSAADRPVVPPALLKALHYPDPRVRAAAAAALGQLGPQAEPAAGELGAALLDRVADVRAAALAALAKVQPALHAQLRIVLTETNRDKAVDAIRAIGALKQKGKAALPLLLYVEHFSEKVVPERVPGAMRATVEMDEKIAVAPGAALSVGAPDYAGFDVLIETLLSIAADDKTLTREFALWMLRTGRTEKRRRCVEAIARTKHREDAVTALIVAGRLEADANPDTAVAIIRLLGDMGRAAKKAVPMLERAEHGPVADVRAAAAEALARIRDDR